MSWEDKERHVPLQTLDVLWRRKRKSDPSLLEATDFEQPRCLAEQDNELTGIQQAPLETSSEVTFLWKAL
ncbi:hypothetical protein Y1Q_0009732 [Alligator mississippiensis]|uniref:Uncharacterized protein n=1 Tax=Alligator mississippiensis TaxID=8496 RepID=A0A151MWL0_ALLMI|nr:hypothetical protein Y1Q_0009732 [Alligator mississippiensis]